MRLLAWLDGEVFDAYKLRINVPFVMQRIHTLAGRCSNLEQHINILRRSSAELFGFATVCSASDAQRIIGRLVELSRVAETLSVPVVMRLDADARLSFEVEEPTFGCGRYLRAKREFGMPLIMPEPRFDAQTKSSVEIDAEADVTVRQLGAHRAVWISEEGVLLSRPWQPIFIYYRECWFTPKRYDTVEFMVIERAIQRLGGSLLIRTIPESLLEDIDEMFASDSLGITSYSRVGNHRLLSSVTNKIAQLLEW